jgi:hypothetical protein
VSFTSSPEDGDRSRCLSLLHLRTETDPGVSLLHLRMETDPVSETLCFFKYYLEYRAMNEIEELSNSEK